MGQYFLIVNKTKKEYVDPHCIGGGAKLWEICANNEAGILPYLLRQSSGRGGGDIKMNPEQYKHTYDSCVKDESGKKLFVEMFGDKPTIYEYAGHWAGDRITVVGDYDDSKLYDIAESKYRNISHELKEEYNKFIEIEDRQLGESYCEHSKK